MKSSLKLAAFVFALIPTLSFSQGNTVNDSFNKAKQLLERQVYYDHRVTLYCGAEFDEKKNITLPAGFIAQKHQKRATRVEWEHVVAAENFGRFFKEWREGDPVCINNKGKAYKGRRCAERANLDYRFILWNC